MIKTLTPAEVEHLRNRIEQGQEVPTMQLKWALQYLRDTKGAMSFRAHYFAIRNGFNTHGIKVA